MVDPAAGEPGGGTPLVCSSAARSWSRRRPRPRSRPLRPGIGRLAALLGLVLSAWVLTAAWSGAAHAAAAEGPVPPGHLVAATDAPAAPMTERSGPSPHAAPLAQRSEPAITATQAEPESPTGPPPDVRSTSPVVDLTPGFVVAVGGSTGMSSAGGPGQGPTMPCAVLGMHDLVLFAPACVLSGPDDDNRLLGRADEPRTSPD